MKLWPHQEQMLDFALDKKHAVWWAWMGTGKTLTALNFIDQTAEGKAIVVVQPSGLDIWPDEAKKWGFDLPVVPLNERSTKARTQTLKELRNEKFCGVIIVPYTGYWRDPLFQELRRWGARTVVYDEAHNLKSAGARQSRRAHTWYRDFTYRLGMSGTLIPNGPQEIYGTARAINPNLFGTSKERFMSKYFLMDYTGYKIVGRQNEDQFNSLMRSFVLRVDQDVVDLPPSRQITQSVTLSDRTYTAMKSLKKDMLAELESGVITASNVLVRSLRLQELASGVATTENGTRDVIDMAKFQAAVDWINGTDEPIVVWTRFQFEMDVLKTLLREPYRQYDGRVKELQAWKDDRARVLLVNLQAGSEGIDLTKASKSLYFGPSYSYKDYVQSIARIDRSGQTQKTLHTFLVSRGSIEEGIMDALQNKKDLSETLQEILRRE